MLLFDDSKKLEKALGEEAAAVIARVFEKNADDNKRELATRADLENGLLAVRAGMDVKFAAMDAKFTAEMANTKAEIIKWTAGLLMAQAALVAALVKLL